MVERETLTLLGSDSAVSAREPVSEVDGEARCGGNPIHAVVAAAWGAVGGSAGFHVVGRSVCGLLVDLLDLSIITCFGVFGNVSATSKSAVFAAFLPLFELF